MSTLSLVLILGVALSALSGIAAGVEASREKLNPKRRKLLLLCVSAVYASIILGLQAMAVISLQLATLLLVPIGLVSVWAILQKG